MKHRTESDSMGKISVPADMLWGAQTQRSLENFDIGPPASMPMEIIHAFGVLKKAAALTNHELGLLPREKRDLISTVCDKIIQGEFDEHFPLVIWQTGSGTQTNMNVNEVIVNAAHVLSGHALGDGNPLLHPNDDVNKSQSSNDTFPTAMHIAALTILTKKTVPAITQLRDTLAGKSIQFDEIVKIGRTHMMDATPLTLGQEFSGYVSMLDHGIQALQNSFNHLQELALGGTAVGTGLNSPEGYDRKVADHIASMTGLSFKTAPNKFAALSGHNALVESHGALKQLSISLMKIANDIRLMASGPRSGIGEIHLPANEPGSSIMPGKVNPTQVEALTMVCAQVIGNDLAITIGAGQGHFELNVFKPLIISNFLQSAELLGDACRSFNINCAAGIQPDAGRIQTNLNNSLMLITALSPHIGYEKSAQIARAAHANGTSLREETINLGYLSGEEFDQFVQPLQMIRSMGKGKSAKNTDLKGR